MMNLVSTPASVTSETDIIKDSMFERLELNNDKGFFKLYSPVSPTHSTLAHKQSINQSRLLGAA